jgi:alpha-glucosidase
VEEHITRKQIYNKIIRRLFKLPVKQWKFEEYKTYFVTPTFITNNYFLHADTDGYATFDFRNDHLIELSFLKTPSEIVIGYGSSLQDTNSELVRYKGIMPYLPDWIYDGMILAIQGGTKTVDEKLSLMLDKGAKINGVWSQDFCGELFTFFGKQVLWNWKTDETLYSDLDQHIQKWQEKGVNFLTYINPYLNANEPLFQEAKDKDYLVKNQDNTPFLTKATSFDFGIVDFTNKEAYNWYKELIKTNYINKGFKGWMADFGEYLPTDCLLKDGNGEHLHNSWADIWMKLNREVLEETNTLGDVLFFNRAGYKDNVKYTTLIWNGDQHVDFTNDFGLKSVVRAQLSLSLSGVGISHSDVGGYTTVPAIKRSKELYLRWLELNAFSPVLRSHEGNRPWDNVQFDTDDETINATVFFSTVYSYLKPYLKHVEKEYHEKGYPMIRPTMFYSSFESDTTYFLGEDLYVVPVLKKRTKKHKVYIPCDHLIHIFTGKEYNKGIHIIDAPIGCPSVFYKKDSNHKNIFEQITKYKGEWK